jgi:hypothetical protein
MYDNVSTKKVVQKVVIGSMVVQHKFPFFYQYEPLSSTVWVPTHHKGNGPLKNLVQ